MVNAPPTPPPTTSAELQEAAEVAAASGQQAPIAQQTGGVPDPYQAAFPALVDAASRTDYSLLVHTGEEVDALVPGGHQLSRLLAIAPLMLGYLIQDQIQPARHALERLPDNLLNTPLVNALATLTQVTSNRIYPRVYSTANDILTLLHQQSFFDSDLSRLLTTLLTHFADAFRRRTFQLLSKAYSSLPLALAQEYLGVPAEAVINEASKYQWGYDASNQTLFPKTTRSNSPVAKTSVSSLSTFHFVADSVSNLEA